MLYTFDDSRDSHDWNGFTALTGLNARASGTSVETQVPLFDLGMGEGDDARLLWQTSDSFGNGDLSDLVTGLESEPQSVAEAIAKAQAAGNAYYEGFEITIDGKFKDWSYVEKYKDSDQLLDNPNIDIDEYAGVSQGTDSFFYLRVKGNVLAGTSIPADRARQIPTLSSNSNQIDIVTPVSSSDESQSSPELKGEDTIYIFLDTNGGVPYGFKVNDSFYANQLIEITGQHGIILSSVLYNYTSLDGTNAWDWSLVSAVNSANNKNEFECMVQNLPNEYGVYFHLISWDSEEDDSTSFLVQNKEARGPSYGDEETWNSGNEDEHIWAVDIGSSKVVIVYKDTSNSDYGTAIVGTVSDDDSDGDYDSISFGSEVVFNTDPVDHVKAVYDSANGKVVVVYGDEYDTDTLRCTAIVGTVSGTSISFGSEEVFYSASCHVLRIVYDSSNSVVVIAHEADGRGKAIVGTVSGTSITFGSATNFNEANEGPEFDDQLAMAFDSNSNKVVIAHQLYNDDGVAIVGTVSGTSISFGSEVSFNTGSGSSDSTRHIAATFDTTNNKVVIVYKDVNNSNYGTAIVGTVSGTSISFGSEAVFNSATTNAMRHISFNSNNGVLIAYLDSGTSDGKALWGTVSGTSISFDTATEFNDGNCWNIIALSSVIIYMEGSDGKARVISIPEFSSLLMPIASVLLIVGFNYRRKESS